MLPALASAIPKKAHEIHKTTVRVIKHRSVFDIDIVKDVFQYSRYLEMLFPSEKKRPLFWWCPKMRRPEIDDGQGCAFLIDLPMGNLIIQHTVAGWNGGWWSPIVLWWDCWVNIFHVPTHEEWQLRNTEWANHVSWNVGALGVGWDGRKLLVASLELTHIP